MTISAYDRLNELASELVGDGKSPNVYFVTENTLVVTVTLDRRTAYLHWRQLATQRPRVGCTLQDREHGIVCVLDDTGRRRFRDDYARLIGDHDAVGPGPWIISHVGRERFLLHLPNDLSPLYRVRWRTLEDATVFDTYEQAVNVQREHDQEGAYVIERLDTVRARQSADRHTGEAQR